LRHVGTCRYQQQGLHGRASELKGGSEDNPSRPGETTRRDRSHHPLHAEAAAAVSRS
jgi:hypothetical protein